MGFSCSSSLSLRAAGTGPPALRHTDTRKPRRMAGIRLYRAWSVRSLLRWPTGPLMHSHPSQRKKRSAAKPHYASRKSVSPRTRHVFSGLHRSLFSPSRTPPLSSSYVYFVAGSDSPLAERDTNSGTWVRLRFASIPTTIQRWTTTVTRLCSPVPLARCQSSLRKFRRIWPSCWTPCSHPTTMFDPKLRSISRTTGKPLDLKCS